MFEHFLAAQAPVYDQVRGELAAGGKTSHWMWFIFPQLRALGRSPTAKAFGLSGLDEARAYLAHPVLGARLRVCTELARSHADRPARALFGSPDDLKFRSSMTLFRRAAADAAGAAPFRAALGAFHDGGEDPLTLELLGLS